MESYSEIFLEAHVWDTNWKVLAENFMESYHLPVCHAATIGRVRVEAAEMPGARRLQQPLDPKDQSFKLAVAHREQAADRRAAPEDRGARRLPEADDHPDAGILLVPVAASRARARSASASAAACADFVDDPEAQAHFAALKKLLDEVNEEDRGYTERGFRGLVRASPPPVRSAISSGRTTSSPLPRRPAGVMNAPANEVREPQGRSRILVVEKFEALVVGAVRPAWR